MSADPERQRVLRGESCAIVSASMGARTPSRVRATQHGRVRAALSSPWAFVLAFALLCGCQSQASELRGLADRPPLDYAALVTGGAYLSRADAATKGTFARDGDAAQVAEPVPIAEVLLALRDAAVFQRAELDEDAHRLELREQFASRRSAPELLDFLQATRDRGFDLLVVVEGLQDDSIDAQGVNGRWPVTLLTWALLGIGVFIPDHTFESGVTLRVTIRDLQTGAVVADTISSAGPIDLSLVERGSALGLLTSVLVPPFWVPSDEPSVVEAVRGFTQRRLLLALARELKSEPMRQRLRNGAIAALSLQGEGVVTVDSKEALSAVRIRGAAIDSAAAADFERRLLASLRPSGDRYVYEARLPEGAPRAGVQVLVATIAGNVASATFGGGAR